MDFEILGVFEMKFKVLAKNKKDKQKAKLLNAAMNQTLNKKAAEIQEATGLSLMESSLFLSDCMAKGFWPTKIKCQI